MKINNQKQLNKYLKKIKESFKGEPRGAIPLIIKKSQEEALRLKKRFK